jgi:hypothetical protein
MPRHLAPAFALAFVLAGASARAEQITAAFQSDTFDFGRVSRGTIVEPVFVLRNTGAAPLPVGSVSMRPPLVATTLPAAVPPGASATLTFRLDTSMLQGDVEIPIAVKIGDTGAVRQLTVQGFVVPPIEFVPGPIFFLGATRGESKERSIEVVNHEPAPLRIEGLDVGTAPLTAEIETLEAGRRFRITVRTTPETPVGRRADQITLAASGRRFALSAQTLIHERVYTFPDAVDLGVLAASEVRANPAMARGLGQKLMVYGAGSANFTVDVTTDVPGVVLEVERGPAGDRWQILASLDPKRVQAGPLTGHIVITTNDREFPVLKVPVTGELLP